MSLSINIDRRSDPRNTVLDDLSVEPQAARATLLVDQEHSFFFDHPLDHVPGLLLLEGATQIAGALADDMSFITRIEANFIKYAVLDRSIGLRARKSVRGRRTKVEVDVIQENILRATLMAEFLPGTPLIESSPTEDLQPCPMEPLRKHRAENVLITEPKMDIKMVSAELLQPDRRCLLADSGAAFHPLHLLEAFMQMQRWLNHVDARTDRIRDILLGVAFLTRAPLTRGSAVSLAGQRTERFDGGRIASRSAFAFVGKRRAALMAIKTARLDKSRQSTQTKQ